MMRILLAATAFLIGWPALLPAQQLAVRSDEDVYKMILGGPTRRENELSPWVERPTAIVSITRRIPRNASSAELKSHLAAFLDEIGHTKRGDFGKVYDAIANLRSQPNVVAGFDGMYRGLANDRYPERQRIVQVLGELRDPKALPILEKIIWRPLPKAKPKKEKERASVMLSPREQEEIIQSRAVESVLFLRDTRGRRLADANEAGLKIAQQHESRAVRIAAINAYMWNHGDSPGAASFLYARLPAELHPYVQRPRFHKGADAEAFSREVEAWKRKWASK